MIQGGRRKYDITYLDKFLTNHLNMRQMKNSNSPQNIPISGLDIIKTEPNVPRKEMGKHYLNLGFKFPASKSAHFFSGRTKQTIKQLEEKNRAQKKMIMINKPSTIPNKKTKSYTPMFKVMHIFKFKFNRV